MAQNWLIDQIIPDDYNSEEPPLRPNVANGEVEVDGLLTLLHFEATKNQLVSTFIPFLVTIKKLIKYNCI